MIMIRIMHRLCITYGALLLLCGLLHAPGAQAPVIAQDRGSAAESDAAVQVQLELADRAQRRPDGLWVGRLSIAGRAPGGRDALNGGGNRRAYTLRLHQKGQWRRIDFSSARRGLEARLLSRDDGATVWFWDRARGKLARIRDGERLRPVLQSAFSFEDLAGQPLEVGYRGERRVERYRPSAPNAQSLAGEGAATNPAESYLRFTLRPNGPGASRYGRIVLVVADANQGYRPLRKDLFNADRVLIRTLRYHYDSPVLRRSSGRAENPEGVPTRLEMLDLAGAGISVIEFHEFDDVGELPDAFFEAENLNR